MNSSTSQNLDHGPSATPLRRISPGPSTSVLQQKRRLRDKTAHNFIGGKSRRVEQAHAPPLQLAEESSFQVQIRGNRDDLGEVVEQVESQQSSRIRGPRERRSRRPLPPTPASTRASTRAPTPAQPRGSKGITKLPLGRFPSFSVEPQPAVPHVTVAPAGLKQQPSFEVLPQSSVPTPTIEQGQITAYRSSRSDHPAQQQDEPSRLRHEQYQQYRSEQEELSLKRFEQNREQRQLERRIKELEGHKVEHERLQVEYERLVGQQRRLIGQTRVEQQQHFERRLEQQPHDQERLEQQLEQEILEQAVLEQQRRTQLEQQLREQQRLEQQRLDQQRLARELEQRRLEQERLEHERLARDLEQRRLEQEEQIRTYQLQLQRPAIPMDVDFETTSRTRSATLSDPGTPKPRSATLSDPGTPRPSRSTVEEEISPLPFLEEIDNDPPPTYQSPAKPAVLPYRVPTPTFPSSAPTPDTASMPAHATAQIITLLLQQGERTNTLIDNLVRENRQMRSVITSELRSLKAQLVSCRTAQGTEDDAEGEDERDTNLDTDDEATHADVEDLGKQVACRKAQRQKKTVSVLKDPKLKEAVTYLQGCVRKHLMFLCDVTSVEEVVAKNPPITDQEMQSFIDGDDSSITCSVQHFRIDFQRPWKENSFNKLARDVFVKSFLAMLKSGEYSDVVIPPRLATAKAVGAVLDTHMDYKRKIYRKTRSPPSKAEKEKESKRKAMNTRRQTLRENRASVILNWRLDEHKALFLRLRPIHMSGDETDGPERTHPPTFRIVDARWQSLELKTFLRTLDALYRAGWAKPIGNRATSGNPPRYRVERPDGRSEDGVAPIGLWRNCYDNVWLESLRPHVRDSLEIIDDDYVFTLPKLEHKGGEEEEEEEEE